MTSMPFPYPFFSCEPIRCLVSLVPCTCNCITLLCARSRPPRRRFLISSTYLFDMYTGGSIENFFMSRLRTARCSRDYLVRSRVSEVVRVQNVIYGDVKTNVDLISAPRWSDQRRRTRVTSSNDSRNDHPPSSSPVTPIDRTCRTSLHLLTHLPPPH